MSTLPSLDAVDTELDALGKSEQELSAVLRAALEWAPRGLEAVDAALSELEQGVAPIDRDALASFTLPAQAPQAEALQAEALQAEALQAEALQAEALQAEALQAETLQAEALQAEALQAEALQAEEPVGAADAFFSESAAPEEEYRSAEDELQVGDDEIQEVASNMLDADDLFGDLSLAPPAGEAVFEEAIPPQAKVEGFLDADDDYPETDGPTSVFSANDLEAIESNFPSLDADSIDIDFEDEDGSKEPSAEPEPEPEGGGFFKKIFG